MLQRQNDRLARALRHMAARIDKLESAQTCSSRTHQAATHTATEDVASNNTSHASIADILEQYAPESSDVRDRQMTSEGVQDRKNSTPDSLAQQMPGSKKRRVQNVTLNGSDVVPEQSRAPYMLMPYPATQDFTSEITASSNMPSEAGEYVANGTRTDPALPSLDAPDTHLQAYHTFLHMSQAHKGLIAKPGALSGRHFQSSDGVPGSLETLGQSSAMDMSPVSTNNNGLALGNEGFQDPLLDLVDWDASLQNCEPIFWDWQSGGE